MTATRRVHLGRFWDLQAKLLFAELKPRARAQSREHPHQQHPRLAVATGPPGEWQDCSAITQAGWEREAVGFFFCCCTREPRVPEAGRAGQSPRRLQEGTCRQSRGVGSAAGLSHAASPRPRRARPLRPGCSSTLQLPQSSCGGLARNNAAPKIHKKSCPFSPSPPRNSP